MTVIDKPIDQIREYENNPRHNESAIEKVAESIAQFGFQVPIVIDKDGVIVTGHTRYNACKLLGFETIPCVVADELTDEQVKKFRLVDNKVSEFATWDYEALQLELADLDGLAEFEFPEFDFSTDPSIDDLDVMLSDSQITSPSRQRDAGIEPTRPIKPVDEIELPDMMQMQAEKVIKIIPADKSQERMVIDYLNTHSILYEV